MPEKIDPLYTISHFCLVSCFIVITPIFTQAQNCPANLDFESGTFDGWTCYTGSVAAVGTQNVISINNSGGPVYDQHTMFTNTGTEFDPYGGFPVNCPNGSGHSIKLGNNKGGGQAEGISYEFTIPPGRDVYNLIYHYAVVFQDPDHRENEQPRMEIEIMNVTDNAIIDCSSFTFRPFGTPLPGFQLSPISEGEAPIWFKDWSAVSINLNGNAGKRIRLTFKTADCTFRRHFGYAYIDVNSECSEEFVGASFCPGDTAIKVTAPFGYQQYTWFNSDFSNKLGNFQSLTLNTAPNSGTRLAVELVPYNGYGCLDTLYAILADTLTVRAIGGPDKFSCNMEPVQLGAMPRPGWIYQWSPATGLTNPNMSNPFAGPAVTTNYILTTSSFGGGCREADTVLVIASVIDKSIRLSGTNVFCEGFNDSAVLYINPTDRMQWYRDGFPVNNPGTRLNVTQSGTYYAALENIDGCKINTDSFRVVIDKAKPGINYPLQYALIDEPLPLKARAIGESVTWRPATGLNNAGIFSPVFTDRREQLYTIEIKTATGCITIDTQAVKIIDKVEVLVPTAFTPNNDGRNDQLRPIFKGIRELKFFRIYNRWGYLLYESRTLDPSWDGTLKNLPQPSQSVVWLMQGIGIDGKMYTRKGTTILIR